MTDLQISLHTENKNPARLYALYLYTSALSRRVHYTTFGRFSLLILAITALVYEQILPRLVIPTLPF